MSSAAIDLAKAADDGQHLVSVVVPTRDSIRTIERCLRSIREQTWPVVDLVVVDNYSTDGTWEVDQEFAHWAIQADPERSTQRNAGDGALSAPLQSAVGAYSRNWHRVTSEPGVALGVLAMRVFEFAAYGLGTIVGWGTRAGG
jgi:hypothetical protein